MQRRERVNPGYKARYTLSPPREGARANSSPESLKQTTCPAPQLEAFAGRNTGKKGREGGERKVGTGYLNLNQNRKEN